MSPIKHVKRRSTLNTDYHKNELSVSTDEGMHLYNMMQERLGKYQKKNSIDESSDSNL